MKITTIPLETTPIVISVEEGRISTKHPSSLRNTIDPISEQDQFRNSSGLLQTPSVPLFPDRGTISAPGTTVPYDAQASRQDQATSVKS